MSKCNCPDEVTSLYQLCATCEQDYLDYLDELASSEPEPDFETAALFAEVAA